MKKYKIASLFSGCGGLDLGFRGGFEFLKKNYPENNFELIWANDIDKNACLTYENYFKHPIACGDIRDILIKTDFISNLSNIDIVLGGFPCQDFSHAGKRKGFDSERGTLYQAMSNVIMKLKPALFLAENVKGLLTLKNGEAMQQILEDFEKLGYHVAYKLLLTSNFGVPQKRERVVIIGTRKDTLPKFKFSQLLHETNRNLNLEMAIGDLENIKEGETNNHFWSKAKKNKGQGNTAVLRERLGPTMRAEHHGNIEFHWNNTRRLSAREAARIQSFPDDFIFYPSTSSAYRQIGNAVPPVFAWHLAHTIENFMNMHLNSQPIAKTNSHKVEIVA